MGLNAVAPLLTPGAGLSADAVLALSELRREPGWLRELRREAWAAFERFPMPTQTTEGWRRIDLRGLRLDASTPWAEPLPPVDSLRRLPRAVRAALSGADAASALLVQQDSSTVLRLAAEELARQGVVVADLDQATREMEPLLREHLGSVVSPTEQKFTALHYAFLNCGVVVYVPRGVAASLPLHLLNVFTHQHLGAFCHVLVVAEPSAEITLVDEYRSAGRQGQALASGVVEVVARPGARVRYVQLQQSGAEQWTFSTLRARLEREAAVTWLVVALGGSVTRGQIDSLLAGEGSETQIVGLVFGDDSQQFDYSTLQSHEASRSRSALLFKTALRDRARSNYTGMVRIGKQARGCDATQESRNLLLSKGAKADADPRLEILNSDVVRATHGASVGPLDQEMLYYVMTRGLSRADAERLLLRAFFEPVLAKVPLAPLRKRLWGLIETRLAAGDLSAAA